MFKDIKHNVIRTKCKSPVEHIKSVKPMSQFEFNIKMFPSRLMNWTRGYGFKPFAEMIIQFGHDKISVLEAVKQIDVLSGD